jgi:NDP-sugar pyrophosphorylase family protein
MDRQKKTELSHAILLAAGLGQRMRPLTNILPKPMLPLVDQPLIKYNIDFYMDHGFTDIGINLHHKYDITAQYLDQFENIFVVVEDQLRGTGGALTGFKDFAPQNFLMHSCDVISDLDVTGLISAHIDHNAAATLALRKNQGANIIALDQDLGIRTMIGQSCDLSYDYAGTAILSERIFSYLPAKTEFSIIDIWNQMIKQGETLIGWPSDMLWYNLNTPNTYWRLHYELLFNGLDLNDHKFASAVYVHPTSRVKTRHLNGFVCIGPNCTVSENVSMTNTIVFQNSNVVEGEYNDCIVSDAFCLEIKCDGEEKNGIQNY